MTAFLIMLREGFEAALVVAIVFVYLRRIGRLDLAMSVWQGVGLAAAVSVGTGVIIHLTAGSLEGAARMRAFAAISLLAVAVLTWMIFWMRRQSRLIKSDLEHKVDHALQASNTRWAIALVAFVAVLREGLEASLFLIAAATDESGSAVLLGGFIGLVIASIAAYAVYWGGRSMPMKAFFTVTGVVLIVFAAGLMAKSVMFLQAAGDLSSANLNGVYDVRSVSWLTTEHEVGKFLSAIFGWDPRPSIEQVIAWFGYAIPVTYLFLRTPRKATSAGGSTRPATEAARAGEPVTTAP